jgi:hypothetical protein
MQKYSGAVTGLPFRSTWVHPRFFCGVRVAQSLVSYEVFCRPLFVLVSFFLWPLYYLLSFGRCIICCPLAVVLSVVLWPLYYLLSFGRCIICCPSIYGFRLPHCGLHTFIIQEEKHYLLDLFKTKQN